MSKKRIKRDRGGKPKRNYVMPPKPKWGDNPELRIVLEEIQKRLKKEK